VHHHIIRTYNKAIANHTNCYHNNLGSSSDTYSIWYMDISKHTTRAATLLITVQVASAASPSDPWHADTRRPGIVSRLTTQTHSSQTNRSKHTHASASIQQPEGVVVVHLHHPAADTARTQATHSLDHTPRPARPVCCSMQAKPASCRLLLAAIHTRKSS